jgi:hypothetical protein
MAGGRWMDNVFIERRVNLAGRMGTDYLCVPIWRIIFGIMI